jgi:endonuclease/exonuclease/phosphatase family metal-dependent hydrolase
MTRLLLQWLLLLSSLTILPCPLLEGQTSSFTVLTWNIRNDHPQDGENAWPRRREALAAEVLGHRPAIIALQEALIGQVRFLDGRFGGYRRYGVGREDGKERGEYCPVWVDTSRFDMLHARTIWLSPSPDQPGKGWDAACERIATLILLRDRRGPDTLWLVNTHWDHQGEQARRHSAGLLLTELQGPLDRDRPMLLLGDLNAAPDSEPLQKLYTRFADACPPQRSAEGTFNGFDPAPAASPRIDYVLYAGAALEALDYYVPRPMLRGRPLSDHYPVLAGFVLRRSREGIPE